MIKTTVSGIVIPVIGVAQMPQMVARPLAFMEALKDTEISPAYGAAIASKVVADQQKGREFVDKAREQGSWNEPRRAYRDGARGHHVDTWA